MRFHPVLTYAPILAALALAAALAAACHDAGTGPGDTRPPAGMASCVGNAYLTRSPVALSALESIVPLGNLNPTGHVFPTDHVYLWTPFLPDGSPLTPVVSPGTIVVTQAGRQSNSGDGRPTTYDYILKFYPCSDVLMYFYHLTSLTPELLAQVGSFDAGCSPSYVTGGNTYQQCSVSVEIALSAGTPIGTMGGPNGGGFDLGGYDGRLPPLAFVDPGRTVPSSANQTICPLDYFVPAVADSMRALLGGYSGRRRTVAPLCGTTMQDVANTAQGRWYFNAVENDDPHLALVHDNVDPTQGTFSVGTSIPSLPPGVYFFTPAASGRVNTDFSRVTADGSVYCYENLGPFGTLHILVQMPSATTLKIAGVAGPACGSDPSAWSLGSGATQFQR